MLTELWTGLGGKLAERWTAALFSPAFAFWAEGLVAWSWRQWLSSDRRQNWLAVFQTAFSGLRELTAVGEVLLAVGLLLMVTASGGIVRRLSLPVLRPLEGYWPAWLGKPRDAFIRRQSNRQKDIRRRLRELHTKGLKRLSNRELSEYVHLDERQHRMPPRANRVMPTQLGNILRAAEGRPGARYGLDAAVCWPRLWLLLPDAAKEEVTQARAALDRAVQLWIWGALSMVWTVWTWWALPLGLLVMLVAHRQMLRAASIYGDLIEACFDLHRGQLYEALDRSQPANPAEELHCGRALTKQLWRGPSLAALPVPGVPAARLFEQHADTSGDAPSRTGAGQSPTGPAPP
jgi:hypothetical protein